MIANLLPEGEYNMDEEILDGDQYQETKCDQDTAVRENKVESTFGASSSRMNDIGDSALYIALLMTGFWLTSQLESVDDSKDGGDADDAARGCPEIDMVGSEDLILFLFY